MGQNVSFYPKAGPMGGCLIRRVIRFLRGRGVSLPITSHILIATSGGCDSVALAHLMTFLGRKIMDRKKISFLHINHRWRGEESDQDEEFVRFLGNQWGIPVQVKRLSPSQKKNSRGFSLEEKARQARKKIFSELAQKQSAQILTAHQADDLAETVLWRLFTGAAQSHGGGIPMRHGVELRPFLTVRKFELKNYLKEVSVSYREDSSNFSDRFLRARMRSVLMGEVEKLFPRAIDHLGALALKAQSHEILDDSRLGKKKSQESDFRVEGPEILIRAAGLRVRRPHLTQFYEKWVAKQPGYGEIHLPGGWKLIREKSKSTKSSRVQRPGLTKRPSFVSERWVLERLEQTVHDSSTGTLSPT